MNRLRIPAELGETLLEALSRGAVETIEPLLDDNVFFQHHPMPAARGKAKVLGVTHQLARHTQWSLVERHAVVANENFFLCERTECIRVMGLEMHLRGVMVLECHDGKIVRITDYMDLTHCMVAFFRALFRLPLQWLGKSKTP